MEIYLTIVVRYYKIIQLDLVMLPIEIGIDLKNSIAVDKNLIQQN